MCNGRGLVVEPDWTGVRPTFDYVITDAQLMAASGNVQVHNTDIGCSDRFLVWKG